MRKQRGSTKGLEIIRETRCVGGKNLNRKTRVTSRPKKGPSDSEDDPTTRGKQKNMRE